MISRALLVSLVLSACGAASAAPVKITFWHSMDGVADLVEKFADDFNRSQDQYEVVPSVVGNYREAEPKLLAAVKAGKEPVMFQAELTFFPKLAADGLLANLDRFEKSFGPDFARDFYPALWAGGEVGGVRYGLPWNVSVPVMYYNAGALRRAGVGAPRTLADLEAAARKLGGRGKKPLLTVADAWTFESLVAAQGGSVTRDGKPNFTSPEVVAALDLLARMVQQGTAVGRTLDEAPRAAFDFARGQNSLVFASVANWPDFQKLALLFELGGAPMPCAQKCAVSVGGANVVVLKSASAQEQAGAVAFWKYLMEPANLRTWVERTFYVAPRRSVQGQLADFYAKNPYRAAAFAQLDSAVPRPKEPGYALWRLDLEEAISKATRGGVPARQALEEAQRKALAR
ncbi:ABC transporter substrate-binding protein [Deinococcus pimensis]|uniref:ABC transporter substrate-binding protein n=1 Tax=Deinococcus pimensis TaxID=309888 RepID=UPI0004BB1D13|nr:ABC transporter substrate-binding protein [Deinococcus pimensis]